MNKTFHSTALFLFAAVSFSFSQKTADFLILEKPQKYAVLDQYQQPLSGTGRAAIAAGTPLQIISSDELLGDQITHALAGSFDGKTWYLQKDEAGNYVGVDAKEPRRVYKGCEIGSDTVEIVRDRAVAFSDITSTAGGTTYLNKLEKVIRIFRNRDQRYVRRRSEQNVRYGWSSFSNSGAWHRVVAAAVVADTGISDYLQGRIVERFRTANDTYRRYFEHFNKVTGKEKTVPVWQWDRAQGKAIHFILNAPYRTGSMLDESTRYLVRDLENMLIGKKYDVACENGDVTVKPKDATVP
jgi:hypothetical protein